MKMMVKRIAALAAVVVLTSAWLTVPALASGAFDVENSAGGTKDMSKYQRDVGTVILHEGTGTEKFPTNSVSGGFDFLEVGSVRYTITGGEFTAFEFAENMLPYYDATIRPGDTITVQAVCTPYLNERGHSQVAYMFIRIGCQSLDAQGDIDDLYDEYARDAYGKGVPLSLSYTVDENAKYATAGCSIGDGGDKDTGFGAFFDVIHDDMAPPAGNVTVDTHAGTTRGDDASASADVPTTIAVGVVSAVAAIGAAGAAAGAAGAGASGSSGGNESSPEEEKRRSTFRMIIHKDFGDAIRYDKQPVPIYARMEETTTEGAVLQRPDLNARISISSGGGVSVSGCALAGDHMGAWICAESAPGGQNATEGTVSFRFSGEGGTFTNNVRFRLIGEPYLAFPQRGVEPSPTVYAIEGDGRTYRVVFELRDFENPATVRFEGEPPFDVILEQTGEKSYIALLKNETAYSNKNMVEWHNLRIIAENETEMVHEDVAIGVYQEGLALDQMKLDDDGRIVVVSHLSDADTEAGKPLPTVRLRFTLATIGEDKYGNPTAVLSELREGDVTFGELTGYNVAGNILAENYKYSIEAAESIPGTFYFKPESQIPEGDSPNLLSMEVKAGEHELTLCYRLLGEKQAAYTNDFDKELKAYLARVRRYMPPEEWIHAMDSLNFMLDASETPEMSTTQLRLMSRQLLEWAIDFYTRDAEAEMNFAAFCEWAEFGADWVKWFGDQAFKLLMIKYAGPTAAAIIVPLKELTVDFIGDWIASSWSDTKLSMEFKDVNNKVFEYINDMLKKGLESGDPKMIAAVIVTLIFSNFVKNLLNNGRKKNYGIYDAIIDTAKDMTVTALKRFIGTAFKKWVEDGKLEELYNKYAATWFKEALEKYAPDVKVESGEYFDMHGEAMGLTKFEYLEEVLDNLFGDSVKLVVDQGVKAYGNPIAMIGGAGVYVIKKADMLSRALEFIFSWMLSQVTYIPTAAIEVPIDPPYFKNP